mmetsp:Transcript_46508/g.147673  ORF Transcript_46508/g.147673 Transcript_46508/m.147673 type:complete len:260 (-) Transcript_46508:6-785(-)
MSGCAHRRGHRKSSETWREPRGWTRRDHRRSGAAAMLQPRGPTRPRPPTRHSASPSNEARAARHNARDGLAPPPGPAALAAAPATPLIRRRCPALPVRGSVGGGRRAPVLNELQVDDARLVGCKAAVLVKDGNHRPALHAAQAADKAAGAVLALVAVYEHGVVGAVKHDVERALDHLLWHLVQVLVPRHPELVERDALRLEEAEVRLWVLLRAQVHHRAEAALLQEAKVLLDWEGGAEDTRPDHGEVGRRQLRFSHVNQ